MKWGDNLIYLDGSSFFFDIESCFSKLVASAREQNAEQERDKNALELCRSFAEYYNVPPENVRAARDHSIFLRSMVSEDGKIVIPEFDDSSKLFYESFPGKTALILKKMPDMKLRPEKLIAFAEENSADIIFLSSPCCPTSLEMSLPEIEKLAKGTKAKVIVDESHLVEDENSAVGLTKDIPNLIVIKKLRFGGGPVLAAGKNLAEFDCEIPAPDQAAASIIFEHSSALKTTRQKLEDSRNSLYIRIKKLAVKFDSLERLYRSKADCVFFKVKDAGQKAELLKNEGISVKCEDGYLCIFAGNKEENEAVLKALETIL